MDYKENKLGHKTNKKGRFNVGKLRTIKNLQDCYNAWGEDTNFDKKLLQNYFNVSHPPIYVKDGMENIEVYLLYAPPQLHIGILGPGNDDIKNIEKLVNISNFKAKYCLKGHGPGSNLNGPQLKDLMSNKNGQLDELELILKEENKNICLL